MCLKKLRKWIRRKLTFWHEIEHLPKWADDACAKWDIKYTKKHGHPRNIAVYFKGKHYRYKAEYGESMNGPAPCKYFKKKRIK